MVFGVAQVKRLLAGRNYTQMSKLKADLTDILGVVCFSQKWVDGAKSTNVFLGWRQRQSIALPVGPLGGEHTEGGWC